MSGVRQGGVWFVQDDKKASAWSFDPVFEFLAAARATRKVLVVGTISDYPGSTTAAYVRLARRALAVADEVAFVGPQAERVRKLDAVLRFATVREAADHFRDSLRDGDLVVLKGSNRADHLRRILLAREREVRCWRESCGKVRFCEDCRLL
jgi:UDP-N-acetylmuramyl pentapeptide synthase